MRIHHTILKTTNLQALSMELSYAEIDALIQEYTYIDQLNGNETFYGHQFAHALTEILAKKAKAEQALAVEAAVRNAQATYNAVINYTIKCGMGEGGIEFLRCWREGNLDAIRKEWPDAPEAVYLIHDESDKDTSGTKSPENQEVAQSEVEGLHPSQILERLSLIESALKKSPANLRRNDALSAVATLIKDVQERGEGL